MPRPWERRRVVYRRPIGAAPVRQADEAPEAYVQRRDDDIRRQLEADREATDRARREAYERGVREGRRSKKGHPLLTLIVVALAVLGLVFVGLWIRSGSPTAAGAQIGTAADVAQDRALDAAATTGDRVSEEIDARTDGRTDTPPLGQAPVEPATATSTTTTTTTQEAGAPPNP